MPCRKPDGHPSGFSFCGSIREPGYPFATASGNPFRCAIGLEAQHDSSRVAELVLRIGIEMGEQIVDLDRTQRDKRQDFQVQPAAECGGKSVARGTSRYYGTIGGIGGFVGSANQEMREGRNGAWKAKLRTDEISL